MSTFGAPERHIDTNLDAARLEARVTDLGALLRRFRQRPFQPYEHSRRDQLRRNSECHQRDQRMIVQQPHHRAAREPCDSIDSIERSERAATLIHRYDLRNPSPQRCVLRSQTCCPAPHRRVRRRVAS